MCDDCCICISVGCPTKINPSGGDGQARLCPRCNNGSVWQSESQTWIEICFLPLFPCRSKDVWHCNICNWQADLGSFQPIIVNSYAPGPVGAPQMQMQPEFAPQPPPPAPVGQPPMDQYPGGYGR